MSAARPWGVPGRAAHRTPPAAPERTGSSPGALSLSLEVVDDLPGEFAERFVEAYHYRAAERFGAALSSGEVAQQCYERLAQHAEAQIDWWLVELWAAETDLVRQALLNRVGAAYALHPLVPLTKPPRSFDVVHLDLRPDGRLAGHLGSVRAELVVVTAAGADRAAALADLRSAGAEAAARVPAQRVVLLADRDAAEALPAYA